MGIISVRDLDVGYGGARILSGMNFSIAKGRITAIVGESGSGKSTLLKTMIGLIPPLQGDVLLGGERIDFNSELSLGRLFRRIGVLYQNSALLDALTLYENVALPIRMHHPEWPKQNEQAVVRTMLGRVGLNDGEAKYPFELSGGMRKRAAIARAMILEPELIFCDEPSSKTGHAVTFVVVTHELRSIARIADRVLVLRDEKIVYDGEYADILRSDDPYLREFFLRKADHDH
jgi:phospholipid/cholesterol/gamma-HCH transport system ATP-binding protein